MSVGADADAAIVEGFEEMEPPKSDASRRCFGFVLPWVDVVFSFFLPRAAIAPSSDLRCAKVSVLRPSTALVGAVGGVTTMFGCACPSESLGVVGGVSIGVVVVSIGVLMFLL